MKAPKLQLIPDSGARHCAKPTGDTHEAAAITATVASGKSIAKVKRRPRLAGIDAAVEAALKALPFVTRMRLTGNSLAFLFGRSISSQKACGARDLSFSPLTTANHAYDVHVTKDSRSWNPFEAMGCR